ncbi:MAG: hypothetical protein Q8807_00320 ['Waltheria sp.' little leaf phytoplasma]|nr:hypothetical protein ['Waltheria sp.' little leaf phytoplasma]
MILKKHNLYYFFIFNFIYNKYNEVLILLLERIFMIFRNNIFKSFVIILFGPVAKW